MAMSDLEELFAQRLVVAIGAGGVGKTTTTAALAVAAAQRGRRTAVITVDPARRLQDALGLTELGVEPQPVKLAEGAHLDALALDTKRTFDALVGRFAPTRSVADAILTNPLYRELSNELGGSTEYMAMEKLYELVEDERYDLVVVDTPPGANTRDLLSAPLRLTELLASNAVQYLTTPAALLSGATSGLRGLALKAILMMLQRWTGLALLEQLADFSKNFEHVMDGFRSRADDIAATLRAAHTSFILVTTPEPDTIAATLALQGELRDAGFPLAGTIANRVHDFPPLPNDAGRGIAATLRAKLLANYADYAALTSRDEYALGELQRASETPVLAAVPVMEELPTSVPGLEAFAALLAGDGESVSR